MPAKSKAQQKIMGMALSYKRGEFQDAPASIKKIAKGMTEKELEDFAGTKHKGKPEHVKSEERLRKFIREELLKESRQLNRAYDNWHDASSALLKVVRKEMGTKEVNIFLKAWDKADRTFLEWFDNNDLF